MKCHPVCLREREGERESVMERAKGLEEEGWRQGSSSVYIDARKMKAISSRQEIRESVFGVKTEMRKRRMKRKGEGGKGGTGDAGEGCEEAAGLITGLYSSDSPLTSRKQSLFFCNTPESY